MAPRRPLIVAVTLVLALAWLAGTSVALAAPGGSSHRVKALNSPGDLPTEVCGFPIYVAFPVDRQYITHDTTLADGTETLQFNGKVVVSLTNTDNDKTIIESAGGPGTMTFYPDGSGLTTAQGHWIFYFLQIDQAAVGEPGLVQTSGHAIVTSQSNGDVTGFTLSGTQTNLCDLLK